jgi:hypothetical protein
VHRALKSGVDGHRVFKPLMATLPSSPGSVRMGKHRPREKFAVLVLVEPGTFDVEQAKPGEPGEREGIDGELRERPIGAGVGL